MRRTTFRRIASAVGVLIVLAVGLALLILEGKFNYKQGVELTRGQYETEVKSAAPKRPPRNWADGDVLFQQTAQKLNRLSPPSVYKKVNSDLVHDLQVEAGYWSEMQHAKSRGIYNDARRHYEHSREAFTGTLERDFHRAEKSGE
jgi:hypothetical protein